MAEDGQGEDRVIMFATDANIKLLCKAQTIYVDGTFQTCPSLFYQVFTIHAFKNGRQFPLVYALLPNIYEFVEVIQKEQTATEVFVLQLKAGARPPRRALKAINRDRKIQELKECFDTNKITLEEYVQGMSAHTNV